jgi:hypothetical protein
VTSDYLAMGWVVRATPCTHDYLVQVPGRTRMICVQLADAMSRLAGTSSIGLLTEGTPVLIWSFSRDSARGVILGALPSVMQGLVAPEAVFQSPVLFYLLSQESGAAFWSESAYLRPATDPDNRNKLLANSQRPGDTLPGDWGKLNHFGAGFALLGLVAQLRATDRAKVEVHILDDLVRVVSGQYQHFSALGEAHVYNDGGLVSAEFAGSPHQAEVAGTDGYTEEGIFEQTDRGQNYLSSGVKLRNELQTLKRRLQIFAGSLGDLLQVFIGNPGAGTETYDKLTAIQGLLHAHVDGSGRLSVRAANGIALTRADRLPVPKKLKEPWDPAGDHPEADDFQLPERKPFQYDAAHPYARNLQLNDGEEWLLGLAYRAFDTLQKDWYTPQAKDLPTPANQYDKLGNATENYDRYAGRKAGVFVNPDGSLVLRDAWGSEIYLRGGDIVISCAGNIINQTGKDSITLAGRDVIIKAKNSADLSATDKDVRIKAQQNLHAYSKNGGILLETDSQGSGHGYSGAEGEAVNSRGIVLKAANSTVFIWGQTVRLAATVATYIEAVAGRCYLAAKRLLLAGDSLDLVGKNGNSALELGSSATLSGKSVNLAATGGISITSGTRVLVPLKWSNIDSDPGQEAHDRVAPDYDAYMASEAAYSPYDSAGRQQIKFTFRNASQYGTDKPIEANPVGTVFQLYQAPWQYLALHQHPLLPVTTTDWLEAAVNDTYPWPGKENYRRNVYVTLELETNVGMDGQPKPRSELSDRSGSFASKTLNEYPVVT